MTASSNSPGVLEFNNKGLSSQVFEELLLKEINEIEDVNAIHTINAYRNKLVTVPEAICNFTSLRNLRLDSNEITDFPNHLASIGLETIDLSSNELESIPASIQEFVELKNLNLISNKLRILPKEVGLLANLRDLKVSYNPISFLPSAIGHLAALINLEVDGIPNIFQPPAQVCEKGTDKIKQYLRSFGEDETDTIWVSKIMVVGETSVGKSHLVDAIVSGKLINGNLVDGKFVRHKADDSNGDSQEEIDIQRDSDLNGRNRTCGFNVVPWKNEDHKILNFWDFGGHQPYQGINQVFFTNHSLFLLVYDARRGFDECNGYRWLKRIRGIAPNSPVLIIGTHLDRETSASMTEEFLNDLRQEFPKVINKECLVSNLDGSGIVELRDTLNEIAVENSENLPLMGIPLPKRVANAVEAIRSHNSPYLLTSKLHERINALGVPPQATPLIIELLRDIGEIFYLSKDKTKQHQIGDESNITILKPNFFSEHAAELLHYSHFHKQGLLVAPAVKKQWSSLEECVRQYLLALMEEMDLLYIIHNHDNHEAWILERLSEHRPEMPRLWDELADERIFRMTFDIDSEIPPGIPTYFTARSNRHILYDLPSNFFYHWRHGCLLQDKPSDPRHLALIEALPGGTILSLEVRGVYPQEFFQKIRDGIEKSFEDRFPGHEVTRKVLCRGHGKSKQCEFGFEYDYVLRASSDVSQDVPTIECHRSGKAVDINELVSNLEVRIPDLATHSVREHEDTETYFERSRVFAFKTIKRLLRGLIAQISSSDIQLAATNNFTLVQRELTQIFSQLLAREENARFPFLFLLEPESNPSGDDEYDTETIRFLCQEPGHWHPVDNGFGIKTSDWLSSHQHFNMFQAVIAASVKYAEMLSEELGVIQGRHFWEEWEAETWKHVDVTLVNGHQNVPTNAFRSNSLIQSNLTYGRHRLSTLLSDCLDHASTELWGREGNLLEYFETPEGHRLWLCEEHRRMYDWKLEATRLQSP